MNEDDFLITDNLFCAFDGITSLVKYIDPDGKTGGKLGSYFAKEIFTANSDRPLLEIARLANERLGEEMRKRNIDTRFKLNLWGTTLAAIKLENNYAEYIQIGDSPIVFINEDGELTSITTNYKIDLEILVLWERLVREGVDNIRNDRRIVDVKNKVRKRINMDYGVLNGEKEVFSFIKTGKIPLDDIKHILLMTDGVKVLQEDPRKDEDMKVLISLFLDGGVNAMLKYVRNGENSDPECRKYPRTKMHDDATAIAISL
ncbi:MAG: protein phosphatase 2C domain-containing protein [bacterium]|nr:protein phosphatase 2C domain-containing protein [bacterium]